MGQDKLKKAKKLKISKFRIKEEESFRLEVFRGQDGKRIERWMVNKKDFPNIIKIIFHKYGMDLNQIRIDRDFDWAI